jgi:hypothetical protein
MVVVVGVLALEEDAEKACVAGITGWETNEYTVKLQP